MIETSKYLDAIEFFKEKCRQIEGVYDVILRGTSTDPEQLLDSWSDIDFSVVIERSVPSVYQMLRQVATEVRSQSDFKISITVVELNDFVRDKHNHGIKPEFYTERLGDSQSLLDKNTLQLRHFGRGKHDSYSVQDSFRHVVYLVHDIRNGYLLLSREDTDQFFEISKHILKRSQHVIRDAIYTISRQYSEQLDLDLFQKLFGSDYLTATKQIFQVKDLWGDLVDDHELLDRMVSEAVTVSDHVYKVTCSYMDKLRKRKKIVVFSDCTDIAYTEVYQKLTGELESLEVQNYDILPLVPISNFSVTNAAFSIRLMADLCEEGTIFLVIVNGVNSNPIRVFGETQNGIIFVGNNSGYFSWLLKDFGLKKAYQSRKDRKTDNRSFGGRNVQAPIAARIAAGIEYDEIGVPCDPSLINMAEIPQGSVVHIDNFGLMKINLPITNEIEMSSSVDIFVNNEYRTTAVFTKKMKTSKTGEWVVFPGSSLSPPLLELARVRSQHSADELGVSVDDVITLVCQNG